MSDIKVTQKRIDHLLETAEYRLIEVFGKCLILAVKLENGFVLTESSACVDPKNYDREIGRKICIKRIENRLWELEGYELQKRIFNQEGPDNE